MKSMDDFYLGHRIDKSIADQLGFNPYYYSMETGLTDPVIINGKKMINLASNNYLGLAADERVKEAVIKAVRKYGASLCGTPVATGYIDLMRNLEERFSNWIGLESSVLFSSCYQANSALFAAIAGKDDIIMVDHYAHASLIQGIRASGSKIKPFLHNNTGHLEKLLYEEKSPGRVFVVTESVFSTEGTIAPFDGIVELCEKYQAVPVIDDSHGIGVLGKHGKGILEDSYIKNFQGIYTASLGKSIANTGGIISGKKDLMEYLRYSCPGLIYSTALPPSVIAGIDQVLDIIDSEFEILSAKMWKYKKMISAGLAESGFPVAEGAAPITSISGGSMANTIRISRDLFNYGILTTPFVPPSVPPEMGKVRLIAGANLENASIEKALEVFQSVGGKG